MGLSKQAYNIIPKIREVDAVVKPSHQRPVDEGADVWVREAHPEVTFALLAGLRAGHETGDDVPPGYGLEQSKCGRVGCLPDACPGESARLGLLRPLVPAFDPAVLRGELIAQHGAALRAAADRAALQAAADRAARLAAVAHPTADVRASALSLPPVKPARSRIVSRDDIVDAVACLVTAQRIARRVARTFPAGAPQCDGHGLRMEIVA